MSGRVSDEDAATVEAVNIVASVLSIFGSSFIVICYVYFKKLRSFAFHLVAMLSVSDFFFSIANFLGDTGGNDTWIGRDQGMCTFQALMISYFELTSLLWSVSIAFVLHMAFIMEKKSFMPNQINQHKKKFHLFIWIFPIIMTVLPLTTDSYGDTGGWCWIKQGTAWRYIQFYLFLWMAIAYNSYVYIQVYKKLSAANSGNTMINRIKYYPLVLIVCWTFATIDTLVETFTGGMFILWLQCIHTFFSTSQGLANATVYGLTPSVQGYLRAQFCGSQEPDISIEEDEGGEDAMEVSLAPNKNAHADSSLDVSITNVEVTVDEESQEVVTPDAVKSEEDGI